MRTIAAIALHDLRLVLSDRSAVMWLFLMPVVFATFFGVVMGGDASPTDARAALTVIDEDGGPVARLLLEELESERLVLRFVDPSAKETTPDKIRTLLIPSGLSTAVLGGEQATLLLEKDPGTSVDAALMAQARIVASITAVLGRLVVAGEKLEPGAPMTPELLAASPKTEDLVLIESRFAGEARIVPDGFAQSIPGNAVMFVMLVALTYGAASVAGEREGGQLRRLATTPASTSEIIAGKIVGRVAVAWAQVTVLMVVAVVGNLVFGVTIGDQPVVTWIVLLIYAVAVAPLGVAFGARFTDPDRAASTGVIATIIMAAFGGCWWPLEVVSKPLQTLSLAFPTGWAMRALHGTISFGRGLDGILVPLIVLAAFGAAFSWLAVRSLRIT